MKRRNKQNDNAVVVNNPLLVSKVRKDELNRLELTLKNKCDDLLTLTKTKTHDALENIKLYDDIQRKTYLLAKFIFEHIDTSNGKMIEIISDFSKKSKIDIHDKDGKKITFSHDRPSTP